MGERVEMNHPGRPRLPAVPLHRPLGTAPCGDQSAPDPSTPAHHRISISNRIGKAHRFRTCVARSALLCDLQGRCPEAAWLRVRPLV